MIKLVIQIPCYNEETNLSNTLQSLPKQINNVDTIETLLINDGSTDNSVQIAQNLNITHILNLPHIGLAKAFHLGLQEALKMGADIIVNFDADNQYNSKDIARLIQPIINKDADVVIGNRNIKNIKHFSFIKKMLQYLGSWIVQKISNTKVKDIPSGFRAFSKEAAQKIKIYSFYTYTIENIFQLSAEKFNVKTIDIEINQSSRQDSKLMKNLFEYIFKQGLTIILCCAIYYPRKLSIAFFIILIILCILI